MSMTLHSMIDPRVTAQFYHALATVATWVIGFGLAGGIGVWIWAHIKDTDLETPRVSSAITQDVSWGRSLLWWALGGLWILDGLLQLQPAMPNSAFLEMVVAPALQGQPAWLVRVMGWGIQAWSNAPITSDLIAVFVQCGIGVTLWFGRARPWGRWALWASLTWGLVVWIWGEGLGSILTGHPSVVNGDPGSVFFYMVGAGLLFASDDVWLSGRVGSWTRWGVVIFWTWGALVQTWPGAGYWSGIGRLFQAAAQNPQPAWLSTPMDVVAHWAVSYSVEVNAFLIATMVLLALLWAFRPSWWGTGLVSGLWLAAIWWFGQDFGVLGGVGTDPNGAPVIALLLIAGRLGQRARRMRVPVTESNPQSSVSS